MGKKCQFYVDIMAMHPEVTGSCNLVIIKFPDGTTKRIAVDCGLFQEREYSRLNSTLPFIAENLDICLVTHVHVDHIGRLPYLVKCGYRGPIYATEATCKLLPLALGDSYKVLNSVAKRENVKCLYSEGDVDLTFQQIKPCVYGRTFQADENVKVTFFNNGHLVGAALILLQISYPGQEDINILFTGDYNNKNLFFDVDELPDWVKNLPITVVQESTYGDMDSTEITYCFKENVLKCISNNGTVVALVFSLGRSQEILYVLKEMQDSGELDVNVPIYFDGNLAVRYTDLYTKGVLGIRKDMEDFLPRNMQIVDKMSRSDILNDINSKIIVTSSGTGSYGPAQVYLPKYLTRENTLIQFTGYTMEGTLGYRLKTAQKDDVVEIGGLLVKKKAEVEYTTEFSAHAKADEMIDFLKKFKDLRFVMVNHGETSTKSSFARRILNEVDTKEVGILGEEYFFRIDHYGLVKTLPSKFQ